MWRAFAYRRINVPGLKEAFESCSWTIEEFVFILIAKGIDDFVRLIKIKGCNFGVQWFFSPAHVNSRRKAEWESALNCTGLQQVHKRILNGKPLNFLIFN